MDYRGLSEVTPLLSAAIPVTLELQYELSQMLPNGTQQLISPKLFSPSLLQWSAGHSLLSCPAHLEPTAQGADSPTIYHGWI